MFFYREIEQICEDYIPGSEVTNTYVGDIIIDQQAQVELLRGYDKVDGTITISAGMDIAGSITDPGPLNNLKEVRGLIIQQTFFGSDIFPYTQQIAFSNLKFIGESGLEITKFIYINDINFLLPNLKRCYGEIIVNTYNYSDVEQNLEGFLPKLKFASGISFLANYISEPSPEYPRLPTRLGNCFPCLSSVPPADLISQIEAGDPSVPYSNVYSAYPKITLVGGINASSSFSSLTYAREIILHLQESTSSGSVDNIMPNLLEVGRLESFVGPNVTSRNMFSSLQKVGPFNGIQISIPNSELYIYKEYGSDLTDTYGDFESLETVSKLLRLDIRNIPINSSGKLPVFNSLSSVGTLAGPGSGGGIWLENITYNMEDYSSENAIWNNAFPALTSSEYLNMPLWSSDYVPSVISNFMNSVTILGGLQTSYPKVETQNVLSASLQSLTTIKYSINIQNTNLQNVNFLDGVTAMVTRDLENDPSSGGSISISNNPSLTDLMGIYNIDGTTIAYPNGLSIQYNQSLDQVDATALGTHYNSQRLGTDQLDLSNINNNLE